MERGRTP
ncbi:hypothetical protein VEx25_2235, partial [Vibrio antiquarius]